MSSDLGDFLERRIMNMVQYVSDNFEILFYSIVAVFFMFIFLVVSIWVSEIPAKRIFRSFVTGFVTFSVCTFLFVAISVSSYVWWKNYHSPNEDLQIPRDILEDTRWVRGHLRVYYVDDNELHSIKINGKDEQTVFIAEHPIREYHFSPDGQYMLVVSMGDIYLLNLKDSSAQSIDMINPSGLQEGHKGSISGVRWAPDSKKFCYEIARWSQYSSKDNLYVFDIEKGSKEQINSPARRISSLYWDNKSENLYYLRHEALDPKIHAYEFDIKVLRISLTTLTPELITTISSKSESIPIESLNLRDVDLYLEGDKLSFNRLSRKENLVSKYGTHVGIDDDDYLYIVKNEWFRQRFFKIPRRPDLKMPIRYQYKGGDRVINRIQWTPGGRYLLMEHADLGAIVLDSKTRKIGRLMKQSGYAFGWY